MLNPGRVPACFQFPELFPKRFTDLTGSGLEEPFHFLFPQGMLEA